MGLKFPTSDHLVRSSGNRPHPQESWELPKASLRPQHRTPYRSHPFGRTKGFKSSVPGTGSKTKQIIYILHHSVSEYFLCSLISSTGSSPRWGPEAPLRVAKTKTRGWSAFPQVPCRTTAKCWGRSV